MFLGVLKSRGTAVATDVVLAGAPHRLRRVESLGLRGMGRDGKAGAQQLLLRQDMGLGHRGGKFYREPGRDSDGVDVGAVVVPARHTMMVGGVLVGGSLQGRGHVPVSHVDGPGPLQHMVHQGVHHALVVFITVVDVAEDSLGVRGCQHEQRPQGEHPAEPGESAHPSDGHARRVGVCPDRVKCVLPVARPWLSIETARGTVGAMAAPGARYHTPGNSLARVALV
jgi:hypothetical protein